MIISIIAQASGPVAEHVPDLGPACSLLAVAIIAVAGIALAFKKFKWL
jgi:hypothetical protein